MSFPAFLKPENGLPGRALGAWLDQAQAGLASRFVLVWFVILYTAFAIVASASVGLHPEMLETYVRGLHPAAGYAGAAPLAPLVAGAWFRLFPPVEWAFYLLAIVNAALGLFAADRIARDSLTGDKRIAVLLLLLLTPFWQFFGQGFGATEMLLSTWPIATWCFLRAFATRDLAWSAAAGAAAALAVLGNYASAILIVSFMLAVLAHPARGAFLRSWAPWLALATGGLVLAPHLRWLYMGHLAPVGAAMPLADALRDSALAMAAGIAALGAVLAAWWLAVRPSRAILRETLLPAEPDGRVLVILLAIPPALQVLAAPLLAKSFPPVSTWFLLPVVLLRPKAAAFTRTAAIRLTALIAAVTVTTLAAAPLLAWRRHEAGTPEGREYYRLVGAEVTRAWRLATGQPLRTVTGDPMLRSAVAFYSPDHPDPWPGINTDDAPSPVVPAQLARDGFAAVCRADDETCVASAKQSAAGMANAQFITYSTTNRYVGKPGRLGRFFFILAPPGDKPAILLR